MIVKNTTPFVIKNDKYAFMPYQADTQLDEDDSYVLPPGIVRVDSVRTVPIPVKKKEREDK
jgi:hypothetical protein